MAETAEELRDSAAALLAALGVEPAIADVHEGAGGYSRSFIAAGLLPGKAAVLILRSSEKYPQLRAVVHGQVDRSRWDEERHGPYRSGQFMSKLTRQMVEGESYYGSSDEFDINHYNGYGGSVTLPGWDTSEGFFRRFLALYADTLADGFTGRPWLGDLVPWHSPEYEASGKDGQPFVDDALHRLGIAG